MTRKLHPCARTNAALRREIQESSETNKALAVRLGRNIKTIAKWRRVLAIAGRALSMLRKQKLDPVPCLLIDDGIVKTIVGLALVCQPPEVDRVR